MLNPSGGHAAIIQERLAGQNGARRGAAAAFPLCLFAWRRLLAALCLLVLTFGPVSARAEQSSVRLHLKWFHQFQFAGYYAAQIKGFYRAQGLEVELIEGSRAQPTDKAVLEGAAEFGVYDGGDLIYRRLRGEPLMAVATIFQHSPYVLLSKKSSGIRQPADLVGKRVLISQDQGDAPILAMFWREGIKVGSTYDKTPVEFGAHTWDFLEIARGKADAMSAYGIEIDNIARQYGFEPAVLNPLDYGIDFYGDTLFTRTDFAAKHPQTVERFRRATIEGWAYALAHPDEIIEHILSLPSGRAFRLDRPALENEARAVKKIMLPNLVEIGHVNPGRWEQMAMYYRELGMVAPEASLDGFIYTPEAEGARLQRWLHYLFVVLVAVFVAAVVCAAWVFSLRRQVGLQTLRLTREIDDRRVVESALRKSETDLQITLSSIGDGVIAADIEGRVTRMNPTAERLTGWKFEEAKGEPLDRVFEVVNAETRAKVVSPVRQVLEKGQVIGLANRTLLISRTGEEFQIADSAAPIRDLDETIVGVVLVFSNVTERYRIQETLHETQAILQSALDQSPAGISIADAPTGTLRYVNDEGLRIRGEARDEIAYGMNLEQFFGVRRLSGLDGKELELHDIPLARASQFGEASSREMKIFRADGSVRYLMSRASPIRNQAGTVVAGVSVFLDITETKLAAERIHSLAFFDQTTLLPNRRLLMDRIEHALVTAPRHERGGAILFLDIDHFKNLNDTFGHDVGDELLSCLAQRLKACVRDEDTVGRFGGDAFVVVLEDLNPAPTLSATQCEAVARKILSALSRPFELANAPFQTSVSIGIALFEKANDAAELIKRAEMAMYQAKAGGRNDLCFFDPQMQQAMNSHLLMEADLRKAISARQLAVFYQPQVDARGEIVGAEALVRWPHEQRGFIPPSEFIPVAEETGLIMAVGQSVLRTACRQLARWSNMPGFETMTIAVNVSAKEFHHELFVDKVNDALLQTGANPRRLKLELTEGLLVKDIEGVVNKMESLKAIGVGFSLDDFGTGYSSLSYLRRLPLDQLKIDQSFIRDVLDDANDAAIARTVVALGKSLGLEVIAEGVENAEQKAFLEQNDCLFYQGYLFSLPLPIDAFERYATGLQPGR